MVKYIHKEFVSMLHKVDWMDEATKSRAIEKAKGIKTRIGYAPEILNSTRVMELFHGVSLYSIKLILNHLLTYLLCFFLFK